MDEFDEVATWFGIFNLQNKIVAASRIYGKRKTDGKSRAQLSF